MKPQSVWKSGTNDGFFTFLWHYTPVEREKLNFTIPETVTFLHNRPHKWYFHSKMTDKIMKKKDQKITLEEIIQRFVSIKNKSGIVATYIYDQLSNWRLDWVGIGDDFLKEDSDESTIKDEEGNRITDPYKTIRWEFLDIDGLKDLLTKRKKVNHAILQAFVEPRDEYNNCILVDWSKDHLNIDRRFSKVKLLDFKYSIYQRASTFEQIENFKKVKNKNVHNS